MGEALARLRRGLAVALGAWGGASVVAGAGLAVLDRLGRGGGALRGAARQSAAWGAVDVVVALLAARDARRARGDRSPAGERRDAERLRRVLLVNAGLDVGYVAAGLALLRRRRLRGSDVTGDGAAVVVQGAALLVVDVAAARRLGRALRRARTTAV